MSESVTTTCDKCRNVIPEEDSRWFAKVDPRWSDEGQGILTGPGPTELHICCECAASVLAGTGAARMQRRPS